MKNHFLLFILFCISTNNLFAQDKVAKHTVLQGETVTQIAIKYKTTPLNIFKLNPDAVAGIKGGMQLLIPNNSKLIAEKTVVKSDEIPNTASKSKIIAHTVLTKETVYSLAKKFDTTVEAIESANPILKTEGLKIGSVIDIPFKGADTKYSKVEKIGQPAQQKTLNVIKSATNKVPKTHIVVAKETKYAIAKQYDITIEQLEVQNPQIVNGLEIGMELQIGNIKTAISKPADKTIKKAETVSKPKIIDEAVPKTVITFKDYIIKPKETVYSLANKFGLSQAELLTINPSLSNGVNIGEVIKCPSTVILKENENKVFTNLSKSAKSQERKKLVLLLPFNISKIENDTVNSTASKLKNDKFLNLTLDFYAGALQAIDSAKSLGINMDIKILDSQETKSTSNILNLIENNNLQNADVIIGPFYQSNAERAAGLLLDSKAIVISPLSRETHKSSPNLVVSNISTELVKNAMFDFMKAKDGNILAIIDNKKLATKEYLKNRSDVKFISMNDKNTFAVDSLAQHFSKSKINFVILDSEKTGLILKATNALINLQKTYQVQLVILEKNETLDFDEIPLSRLTRLKMLYPSTSRENSTPEAAIFEKEFKIKNKTFPSNYATRGFDLTFDTILRMAQEKSFIETFDDLSSEQVESKFVFEKSTNGGFFNNGVYILEYQADLTIKEAK